MTLLIAILLKLGFYYTPEQVTLLSSTGQDENVIYAQHIIDDGLYHYDADGGVVLEDGVDPNN